MKKLLCTLALVFTLVLSGCTSSKTEGGNEEAKTPATKVLADFKTQIKESQDLSVVAEKLVEDEKIGFAGASMDVEPGFLNGFDNEIKGFTKGVTFGPMIGSIPFVGYLFETDDAKALIQELKDNANLRWNICTEADEMVVEEVDGYVFFCMAPETIEE